MATQVSHRFFVLWSALAAAGGCGQILGISDYEIDPKLGRPADNEGGRDGADANGGDRSAAGAPDSAGAPGGGQPPSDGGNGGAPVVGIGGAGASSGGAGNGGAGNGGAGNGGAGPAEAGAAGAGGAGGSPEIHHELVPCDSLNCCTQAGGTAEGEELLVTATLPQTPYYGDFELGTVEGGNTPWVETSLRGYPIITDGTDAAPHKGSYFAWLCGLTKETSVLTSEPIHVPADAGWFTLTGFRKFQIDSLPEDTVNDDSMSIGFWNETEPLELPLYWNQAAPGATSGWVKFDASWDAAPHVGEVRYLTAVASTDDHVTDEEISSSNYMLDDLSLKVFRCYR
jgi:hypothetical protein